VSGGFLLATVAVSLHACGGGSDADTASAPNGPAAAAPSAGAAPAPAAAREVAEVSYRISGAISEAHEQSESVMCSSTGQGDLLAQNFVGEWSINLRVAGTSPGTHEAELDLGPPNRDGLWEGRQIDDPRGSSREGHAELIDTGQRDGHGYPIMTIEFEFPEVELRRSGQIVGVAGQFHCGVVAQN
jgi:hypothetical protein